MIAFLNLSKKVLNALRDFCGLVIQLMVKKDIWKDEAHGRRS